jgi:hypothetical protein
MRLAAPLYTAGASAGNNNPPIRFRFSMQPRVFPTLTGPLNFASGEDGAGITPSVGHEAPRIISLSGGRSLTSWLVST